MSKMKNRLKRVISLCLVLMLVVTFVQVSIPVKADAADTAEAALTVRILEVIHS